MCGNLFAVNFPPYCFKPELISAVDLIQIINKVSELESVDAVMIKDVQEKEPVEELLNKQFFEFQFYFLLILYIDRQKLMIYCRFCRRIFVQQVPDYKVYGILLMNCLAR